MINKTQKSVLILALHAGEIMMKSGAEIYRVEDTITRICKACRIPYVEVFATTAGIFLSLDEGGESDMYTFIKRIHSTSIDLEKISEVNKFSREFTSTSMSVYEGRQRLKEIEQGKKFSLSLQFLGSAMVSSFFTMMMGGRIQDFVCAFCIGLISFAVSNACDKLKLNFFIKNYCCCALAALLSLTLVGIGLGANQDALIIGSIMMFLPGMAITNAVRDSLSGDLTSGTSRAVEAALIAISIAAGVVSVLSVWYQLGGVI